MKPTHTSCLENLILGPDSASFALDGRPILIQGDGLATARETFRALYASALMEYETGQTPQDRGLLAWFGRLWRKASSSHLPPVSSADYDSRASFGGPVKPASFEAQSAAVPPRPSLQSIFADKDGIRITWRFSQTGPRGAKLTQTVEATYGLDSQTAHRLESCYDALTKLGYEVTTLAALTAPPAAAPAEPRPEPRSESPPAKPTIPSDVPAPKHQPEAGQQPPSLVFRLHLKSGGSSARMLVAPIGDPDNPQVLVAPERLIRALQAGSADSRPADERVTFVRCVNGEKGLKVIEIGLGPGAEREPARWQDAASWWEETGKLLCRPSAIPAAAPGPAFPAGSSPLQTGASAEPSVS